MGSCQTKKKSKPAGSEHGRKSKNEDTDLGDLVGLIDDKSISSRSSRRSARLQKPSKNGGGDDEELGLLTYRPSLKRVEEEDPLDPGMEEEDPPGLSKTER